MSETLEQKARKWSPVEEKKMEPNEANAGVGKMKTFLIGILVMLLAAAAVGQNHKRYLPDLGGDKVQSPYGRSTHQCKCIRNENGECMTFSTRPPAYSRGSGRFNQMLPNCVDNCLPGWVDYETATYHERTDTLKEMEHCYINWNRLERLHPEWRDPNWTP